MQHEQGTVSGFIESLEHTIAKLKKLDPNLPITMDNMQNGEGDGGMQNAQGIRIYCEHQQCEMDGDEPDPDYPERVEIMVDIYYCN